MRAGIRRLCSSGNDEKIDALSDSDFKFAVQPSSIISGARLR